MSIKEKLKKLVAGASVIGMAASFSCSDNKEEAPKKPTPVVKTVEKEEKQDCGISDAEYKKMCENMGADDRLVDWGNRRSADDTCNIVVKGGVIDTNDEKEWVKNDPVCDYTKDVTINGNKVTFLCEVVKKAPCKEKGNRIEGAFKVKVTYANLIPLCQDLAEQCEEMEDCECGTQKDANGCPSCVIEDPDVYYIKDDTNKKGKNWNARVYGLMNEEVGERTSGADNDGFLLHGGAQYEGAYIDPYDSNKGATEPAKCPDDKDKYCLKHHNITFKFKVENLSQAQKECDAKCGKIGTTCGGLKGKMKYWPDSNYCDITDELYDKCKVECAKEDGKPTQSRYAFDGYCVCDNGKEPIEEIEQKTKSQLATKPERIAEDERVQEAQKQIEETEKKSELKSMNHAEAAQTAEDICLKNYLGARYKKGVCEIPFSGNINKLEELKNKKHLQNCQMNGIKKGKGTTATVDAVCKGVKARINLQKYQVQKRASKGR